MSKRGRPKKITKDVLRKLEEGFLKGLSDRECCLYADVKQSTFYDYCRDNPDFSERKEMLKDNTKLRAKINLHESISNGNIDDSKWYLERKCKEEFSLKQELEMSGAINNPYAELSLEELRKLAE